MTNFLLWCLLYLVCAPLAIAVIVLYPIVWLVLLPFRLLGRAASAAIDFTLDLLLLPFRLPAKLMR
jgi:hypothetical protein